jgi:hypothetical protein
MELTDVLLIFAQAAMVSAGFGGMVITFHDKLDKWGEWAAYNSGQYWKSAVLSSSSPYSRLGRPCPLMAEAV